MTTAEWNAYHFVNDTLRDGSPVPANGEALIFDGRIDLCRSGYHASRKAWQALTYAPGHILCRVHCAGELIESTDKLVCTERTIIERIDAGDLLRSFARQCALDVIHLWDAPGIVREYLETGDEDKRAAARDAAAWDAWGTVQTAAARGAARGAARAAAWDAARDAAWGAARDAAQKKRRARFTRMVNEAFSEAT